MSQLSIGDENMTYAKKTILLLLLTLAASLGAAAQDAHTKFTLPHDAVWGKTVLPAGTYSVSVEFGGIPKAYVASEGGSRVAFIAVPETTEVSEACAKSSVTLQRSGGKWNVRSLCFGELQLALYFSPASPETTMAALPWHVGPIAAGR
jgi:hypothetical protein